MNLLNKIIIGFGLTCLLLLSGISPSFAENLGTDKLNVILPNLEGTELLKAVAQEYTPEQTLGYRRGRDILYSKIDNHDGILKGIYTDYAIKLDPNASEPRQLAYQQDINAEHIYPQSKGANGSAKSDLHSLFPSRVYVNSRRGNNPFAEINDSKTEGWFRLENTLETIPTALIDEYSEATKSAFEPRESKEGDVARAMFYFYTIYRYKADAADAKFFPSQQQTLCQWNLEDPVDNEEMTRSHLVAEYQGNENPFVIDSTLASRTYCSSF
ncbi:MAG: endonuclease [Lyngbya sp.]|nr:endonuclease [Lyngbya sp.]